MPDRTGAGCVIGSTKVIVNDGGVLEEKAISGITGLNVLFDLELDYSPPDRPIPQLTYKKYGENPGENPIDIKPIKSLSRKYVYPVIRYHFKNFFSGGFGYPLLNIRVTTSSTDSEVTCTPVHPFMEAAARRIVPAYCLKKDDEIFLDPNSPVLTGKIESIILVPPQEVYGLWVIDLANAASVTEEVVRSLIRLVNTDLALYWEHSLARRSDINPVGADDFACSKFDFYWNGKFADPPIFGRELFNDLRQHDFMIITDSIATGTLNVQYGYHEEARKGFPLNTLVR